MARLANISSSVEENNANHGTETASSMRQRQRRTPRHAASLSPSPVASFSSDKENREAVPDVSRQGKGKARAPAPSKLPTPTSAEPATPRTNKRRRLEDRDVPMSSQAVHQRELEEAADTQYYDPDQAPEERRAVRKALRDLTRDLNGIVISSSQHEALLTTSSRLSFGVSGSRFYRPCRHSSTCKSVLCVCQANFRCNSRL